MSDQRPPAANRGTTHPLLVDLVYHSLDPGYAEAAARRCGGRTRRWIDATALVLGGLLAGLVIAVGVVHAHRTAPQTQQVHDELISRLQRAQAADTVLAGRVTAAQRRLAQARQQALPGSGDLASRLVRAEQVAGQAAVHGPGITVTLREPTAPTASQTAGPGEITPLTGTNILTDRDVRSVVNELWHDGAEAIAVNGIRLTATSTIRFAGQAILVDFSPITPPYTVSAIGAPDRLITAFAGSQVASRYKTLAGADGIGFTFATSPDLALPGSVVAAPRYALPGGPGPRPR